MKLIIMDRTMFHKDATLGDLAIPETGFHCFTLEDAVRDHKVPGATAIPAGEYDVTINFSNRFKTRMPLLLNVPLYEGIRIHSGNTVAHTEGCILVGNWRDGDKIYESRVAFESFYKHLSSMLAKDKVRMLINGGYRIEDWHRKDGSVT